MGDTGDTFLELEAARAEHWRRLAYARARIACARGNKRSEQDSAVRLVEIDRAGINRIANVRAARAAIGARAYVGTE